MFYLYAQDKNSIGQGGRVKILLTACNVPREIFYQLFRQSGQENVRPRILTIPNLITACGLALVGIYAFCFLSGKAEAYIPLLVVLAGTSDLLDGMTARILDQHTHLGKVLDPLRDRLLGTAVLANIITRESKFFSLGAGIIALELAIGGVHVYRLVAMGKISWRAKHTSGKARQAVHLIIAGVFVFQTYAPGFWHHWLGIPPIHLMSILIAMLAASSFALVMLFIPRARPSSHGLRF